MVGRQETTEECTAGVYCSRAPPVLDRAKNARCRCYGIDPSNLIEFSAGFCIKILKEVPIELFPQTFLL